MWKLLPVCLLVSCAANDQQPPATSENQPNQGRIVLQVALPVESAAQAGRDQPSRKTFQRQGMQGWLDETGAWAIRVEVDHSRFRCGTYETGIQLGRGEMACSEVEWLTDVE